MIPKNYLRVQRELEQLPSISEYMDGKRHPKFFLERTHLLLALLGNPEKQFSYIHVGGTAGKGSVTLYLHEILKASKKRVGSFISPHVTTAVERTIIQGKPISTTEFVWAWEAIKPYVSKIKHTHGRAYLPSYFEAQFAMSLLLFKKHNVRWVVLEVGCGGAYDATNTIPAPRVAVLTNVHLDHTKLLGRTRVQIARTKSGIIKHGSRVFSAESDPKIRSIILKKAKEENCVCTFIAPQKIRASYTHHQMIWKHQKLGTLSSYLLGKHQIQNAEIAIQMSLFLHISKKAIRAGIKNTRIPARSEFMQQNPDVLIDGAHNPAKI